MSLPSVSIVIPCYNAARYVGEAIRSALGQTYPKTEVIVIDDGSTDRSLDIVRSFKERVRWETGPNRGGGKARNRGIELARGELVQFLDADDEMYPQKLERQVPLAVKDDSRILYCDYETEFMDGDGGVANRSPVYRGGDPVVFVLSRSGLQTSAPLHWKRHLQRVGGFRNELPCAQERDLHVRLACAGLSFRHLPEVLFRVRRLAGSVSSDLVRVLDQHAVIARRAYELLDQSGQLTNERKAALAGFLASDARAYLRHRLPEKARQYFELAREMHPDGGLTEAYRAPTRWLRRVVGPMLTERLVALKRSIT